ncbi:MAG: hypothetical protein H6625_04595 [Bdellovibrionaceae bacterium]|nr:hypothetical protein [Pseudobdellovibrionaceae bacterium]
MKLVRIFLVALVLLVFSFLLPTAEAIELTNISDNVVNDLQTNFKLGSVPNEKNLLKSDWNCQLYGMRSRLQSTKKNNFYKFKLSEKKIANSGSQVIKVYNKTEHGLVGNTGPLQEEVRIAPNGSLMGEISITASSLNAQMLDKAAKIKSLSQAGNEVIAYSVCN